MFISLARYTCGHFKSSTCIFALPNKGEEGRDEGEHSPRTSFGTPIATNSTWKMRSRKVSAVALYDWDFGGTNVPLPFQHFRPFSFFSLPFYLYIFFRLVTTQPGGLTLRPQSLCHCCCHWHAVDIITNKLCVKDIFQRHVGSDAMIGSFRPLKGGYCGLFDFKIPCTNLNNCFEFKFNRD